MQIPVFTRAPRFLRCLNPLALRRANSWSTLSCLRGGRHPKARKVCENALFWYLLLLAGAVSSFGRAPHLQCGGDRFESGTVHNSEFEEKLTSPAPKARARAPVSAKSRQGILNSAKRIPAESRRFEPMSARKSFIPERFSCLIRFPAWLASKIQFRMSSSQ